MPIAEKTGTGFGTERIDKNRREVGPETYKVEDAKYTSKHQIVPKYSFGKGKSVYFSGFDYYSVYLLNYYHS